MPIRRITPPWEYLRDASLPSLESYELSRLNHAANVRREIAALLDQWIEDTAQAMVARWVRENRSSAAESPELQSELPFAELPSRTAPPSPAARPVKLARRSRRPAA